MTTTNMTFDAIADRQTTSYWSTFRARLARLLRLSIATRAVIIATIGLLALTLTLTFSIVSTVQDGTAKSVAARLDTNVALLWQHAKYHGDQFSVRDGSLYAGDVKLDGRYDLVDAVAQIGGGTATIFVAREKGADGKPEFVRIATNVPSGKLDETGKPGRAVGTKLARNAAYDRITKERKAFRGLVDILGVEYHTVYDPIFNPAGEPIGIMYVGIKRAELEALEDAVEYRALVAGTSMAAAVLVVLWFFLTRLLKPITALGNAARQIAAGETVSEIPGAGRRDEVGGLAASISYLGDESARKRALEQQAEEARRTADHERQQQHHRMVQTLDSELSTVLPSIGTAAETMATTATTMRSAADLVSEECASVTTSAQVAAQHTSAVAAATEELSRSITEISQRVAESTETTGRAVQDISSISDRTSELTDAMTRISRVAQLVQQIAQQTNLLALNATIEAARAGDAGKGFAVVATEVKNLATQTANATSEITTTVDDMLAVTGAVTQGVNAVRQTIQSVDEITTGVAAAIEQQRAATGEIARAVSESHSGIETVTRGIERVSDLTVEARTKATHVESNSLDILSQATSIGHRTHAILYGQTNGRKERIYERFDIHADARINGRAAILTNVSAGGAAARVEHAHLPADLRDPDFPAGQPLTLDVPGLPPATASLVNMKTHGRHSMLHFAFDHPRPDMVDALVQASTSNPSRHVSVAAAA